MAGAIFLKTMKIEAIRPFYEQLPGVSVWLEQADCVIYQQQNLLFGFCQRDVADVNGMLTLFFDTREEVDAVYARYKDIALTAPDTNAKYGIYQFFATDPEGRILEFQAFLHPVRPCIDGGSLLRERRSIRRYKPHKPDRVTLEHVFNDCRYSPTARNTQAFYYIVVKEEREQLAAQRPGAGEPIAAAPLALAVVVDASKTPRPVEDGDIAATYLMLAAWRHGLGTCWIGGMNTDDVKDILGVPRSHYIATVTPVGWPDERKPLPSRRAINELVDWRSYE